MTTLTHTLRHSVRAEQRVTHALVEYCELLACPLDDVEREIRREVQSNPALEMIDRGSARTGRAMPPEVGTDLYPSVELADVAPLLDRADRAVAAWILGDLDSRGFLDGGAAGVARALGIKKERVERVIQALQTVGPPGLCATGIRDCLLLQLDRLENVQPLARCLVEDHLADLAAGRIKTIAAARGVTPGEVLAARDFLRTHLRPWAALGDSRPAPGAPVTDLVLRYDESGDLEVHVVGDPAGRIRVDPAWAQLADRMVREQTRRARSFLASLEERTAALKRVAGYAAARQHRYLREGPAGHVALTRAEVATALGLHESTVSRAVNGKRLRLPDGRVVPFAALFGVNGSVQTALRAIVNTEQRPLSDADLAAELGRRGYPVARRTVAKYREQLGIPARSQR